MNWYCQKLNTCTSNRCTPSYYIIVQEKLEGDNVLDKVSILLPISGDLGARGKAFGWVLKFYETVMPEAEICIGKHEGHPFSKSKAVNDAARKATRDIYVIADTDIIYNPKIIKKSIKLLEDHAIVVPVSSRKLLTESSTKDLLKTTPSWPLKGNYESGEMKNTKGLLNVLHRRDFERVGGFDERFEGWGAEDSAFVDSVHYTCGKKAQLKYYAIHLWHPPADKSNHRKNQKLYKNYKKGRESSLEEIEKRKREE
jgi:N-terminal domain of galactosyltransferase